MCLFRTRNQSTHAADQTLLFCLEVLNAVVLTLFSNTVRTCCFVQRLQVLVGRAVAGSTVGHANLQGIQGTGR